MHTSSELHDSLQWYLPVVQDPIQDIVRQDDEANHTNSHILNSIQSMNIRTSWEKILAGNGA